MNYNQAKQFVEFLSEKWGISLKNELFEIMDELERNTESKKNIYTGFEFSLVEDKISVRLLHLNFPLPLLSSALKKKLKEKRKSLILSIFNLFNQKYQFNLDKLRSMLSLSDRYPWPVQFGTELGRKGLKTLKIYFSITDGLKSSSAKKTLELILEIAQILELEAELLKNKFQGKYFDALGVDFLPNKKCHLKIYTLFAKNRGILNRISPNSLVSSQKKWFHLAKPTPPKEMLNLRNKFPESKSWIEESFKVIEKAKAKISYIGVEGKALSLYFR